MADFEPENPEEIRKSLGSVMKKSNLLIIGVIGGVLLLLLSFTYIDFGNLFQGNIGQQPEEAAAVSEAPVFTAFLANENVNFGDGETLELSYILDQPGFVIFRIFNNENVEVHSFSETGVAENNLTATKWDGKLENSLVLEAGVYTYSAVPENDNGIGAGKTGIFTVTGSTAEEDLSPPSLTGTTTPVAEDVTPPIISSPFTDFEDVSNTQENPNEPVGPTEPLDLIPQKVIEIINDSVFPVGFNPLLNETQIKYEITADTIIEVKIRDVANKTIVVLTDDIEQKKGSYSVWWNGTNKTDTSGKVVSPGKYSYLITAKDNDGNIYDTTSGEINAVYFTGQTDFEDTTTGELPSEPTTAPAPTTPVSTTDAQAMVTLQNTTSGVTAKTGPSALIYLLFPVGGLLFRKKNNK